MPHLLVVGDRDDTVVAHQGIEASLRLLRTASFPELRWSWPGPEALEHDGESLLSDAHGIWCVPASPYRSTAGALGAIRFARERAVPFLGTCGGFQHALLEYARNALGVAHAAHEELDPGAELKLLGRLSCSLVEVEGEIVLEPDSRVAEIVGGLRLTEGFHCNYGLTREQRHVFDGSALRITGTDLEGEPRVLELTDHPFFIGTLFQPERHALKTGQVHPLIAAFVTAARERAVQGLQRMDS